MAEATERPNQVEITDLGPCRKKVRIEIPKETVDEHLESQLSTLTVESEVPGFRKGRAPRRLIEKRFGQAVKQQAKEQLVASAYGKAIEDHKLRVLGNPTSEELGRLEVEPGKPLLIEIEVEVPPEFELPALEGITVKKPATSVTEEMVGKELEKLCIQEGTLDEREVPEQGDYLTGHAKLEGSNGKTYFESDGIVVQVPGADKQGKGMIVGLVVEDFSQQLGLPKPGDTITIKTTGPENHENEELRGMALTVTYKPARVDRIIPAQADAMAARFGMVNGEQLKGEIRNRLEQRVLIEQMSVMRQQIAKHLVDVTKMDLPERFSGAQAARNLERRRLELMYRGVDPQRIEEHLADQRAATAIAAQNDLKVFFMLDKAAEKLSVRVTEQEVNGRIAQIAIERNERPERLKQQLVQSNQIQGVFLQIREHKTLDAIIAKANVSEVSVEEFNTWAAEQAKAK